MQGQIFTNTDNSKPFVGLDGSNSFEKQPIGVILTLPDWSKGLGVSDVGIVLANSSIMIGNVSAFPILEGMVNLEPSGGDIRISQEGFGSGAVNGLNPYTETLTFIKGGLSLYKQLSKLHGRSMRVFFVDEDLRAYGVMDDNGDVRGFNVNFGISYRKNVGTTTAALRIHLLYSANYVKELQNITSFVIPDNVVGLRGLALRCLGAGPVQNSTYIQLMSENSGANVTDSFIGSIVAADLEAYDTNVNAWAAITSIAQYAEGISVVLGVGEGNGFERYQKLRLKSVATLNNAVMATLVTLKMDVSPENEVLLFE